MRNAKSNLNVSAILMHNKQEKNNKQISYKDFTWC